MMPILLPPLDLTDASIVLAIAAIVLLATAQVLPTFYEPANSVINKKKLENAAVVSGILFLTTVVIKVISIIFG